MISMNMQQIFFGGSKHSWVLQILANDAKARCLDFGASFSWKGNPMKITRELERFHQKKVGQIHGEDLHE